MDEHKELLIRIDEKVASNQKRLVAIEDKLDTHYVTKETHNVEIVGLRRWLQIGTTAVAGLAAWIFHLVTKG